MKSVVLSHSFHVCKSPLWHCTPMAFAWPEKKKYSDGGVGRDSTYPWMPFSIIEKAKQHSTAFTLTTFFDNQADSCGQTHCFRTGGSPCYDWLDAFRKALCAFTVAFFPQHDIATYPLPDVESTACRIMAGYLLHLDDRGYFSTVYAELVQNEKEVAHLNLYTRESCEYLISFIEIRATTVMNTFSCMHCNMFDLYSQRFCARSRDERDIWLRGISNVSTKMDFGAKCPGYEELQMIRAAVQERVVMQRPLLQMQDNHPHPSLTAVALGLRRPVPTPLCCDEMSPTNSFSEDTFFA